MSDLPSSGVVAASPEPPAPPGVPLFSVRLSLVYALITLAITAPGLLPEAEPPYARRLAAPRKLAAA